MYEFNSFFFSFFLGVDDFCLGVGERDVVAEFGLLVHPEQNLELDSDSSAAASQSNISFLLRFHVSSLFHLHLTTLFQPRLDMIFTRSSLAASQMLIR